MVAKNWSEIIVALMSLKLPILSNTYNIEFTKNG